MDLYSQFVKIFSQDEDPADSIPTDDNVTEGIQPPACTILWAKSRFLDDILQWASFSPVYDIDSVDR